jgi:hypothetical protein
MWLVGLGTLFTASLLGSLLLIWPERREASAAVTAALPMLVVAPPPTVEAHPDTVVAMPQADIAGMSGEDEDTELTAAALAEPALLDLLEDAGSNDPWVREDAQRLLRDREKPQ